MASTDGDGTRSGVSVLVVEDETLVGMDLVMLLEEWGYTALGPIKSVEEALREVERSAPDVAILDVNLGKGRTSLPIADRLAKLSIPFMFLTGYDPSRYETSDAANYGAPHLRKPVSERALRNALSEMASPQG